MVGFERGAVVYDIDCRPKARLVPKPSTKLHQLHYVPGQETNILAASTEDGRILFFETEAQTAENVEAEDTSEGTKSKKVDIPATRLIAQLGGRSTGVNSRIKDFAILSGRSKQRHRRGGLAQPHHRHRKQRRNHTPMVSTRRRTCPGPGRSRERGDTSDRAFAGAVRHEQQDHVSQGFCHERAGGGREWC